MYDSSDDCTSLSMSNYPSSTIHVGGKCFAGFLETYSLTHDSETSLRGKKFEAVARIKAFLKGHFRHRIKHKNKHSQKRAGYTICTQKKGFIRRLWARLHSNRVSYENVRLHGHYEPFLATVDDNTVNVLPQAAVRERVIPLYAGQGDIEQSTDTLID